MKKRFVALLLALMLILALTACGQGTAASTTETEEKYEVPKAATELSREDEILLNGELKKGEYTNRYFGFKVTMPEGGTLTRLNDDATESTEALSLAKAYENGEGGLIFWGEIEGFNGHFNMAIQALDEDKVGLSEEELVNAHIEEMWEINRAFGDDEKPELITVTVAGEEHPASLSITETNSGEQRYINVYFPKGDFVCSVAFSVTGGGEEPLLACFDKI